MKKNFVLTAVLAVLAMAFTVSAQKAPADFSGKWSLDLAKSKLSDREKASIESQTLAVTQTAADIKVEPTTKRMAPPAPPAGAPPAGGGGGGRMGGGGGGEMAATYPLGKEATTDQQMGQNTVPVTMGSKWDGSKLLVWTSRTFQGPNGEMKTSTKETWEMGADGKTLTISRESVSPRGTDSSTRVYTKS